jgi:hypothetical protein
MLDPDRFPYLAVFVPAYLHQDLEVCGGVEGAFASWIEDTSPDEAAALVTEWDRFLDVTAGMDAGERGRLLESSFGGAWAPRSDEELHTLTRAMGRLRPSREDLNP